MSHPDHPPVVEEGLSPPPFDQEQPDMHGLLAEYHQVDDLLAAARKVRDAGYTKWECYTPCPIHGLDEAMGHKMTILPWIVLICGLTGMATGLLLTWYANATSFDVPYALRGYDFNISGKPYYSLAAFIPPIFELTILFSAFGAFFGMLAMNLLPCFHHPVFLSGRVVKATDDRFYIGIAADDPKFDRTGTESLLTDAGATAIEELREPA